MRTNSELSVQVVDDEIIVTLPGSHYSVTYYKPAKSPQLLAKFISDRDDPRVAMKLSIVPSLLSPGSSPITRRESSALGRIVCKCSASRPLAMSRRAALSHAPKVTFAE